LLTAHYRSKLNFTDDSITAAQNGLNNLRADIASLPAGAASSTQQGWSTEAQQVHDAFQQAINNDLDMPTALRITREMVRNQSIEPEERHRLTVDFDRVLGLRLDTVKQQSKDLATRLHLKLPPDDAKIQDLIHRRNEARAARHWKLSDELRDILKAEGYEVRDTPKGTEIL